jgi:ribonuclease E
MVKRMLIEATHPEETRVVVLDGTRLEEFDVETSTKKQIKGNIYLAKVVRVEPSLQAAFVDYGGNRHGFLAFAEIHPDYYQIPVADRERLMAEVQRQEEEDERRQAARDARREAAAAAGGSPEHGGEQHGDEHADHHGDQHADHHGGQHGDQDGDAHGDHTQGDHHHDEHRVDHHDDHSDDHSDDHGDTIPMAFIPPAITSPQLSDEDHDDEAHDEAPAPVDAAPQADAVAEVYTPPEPPTEISPDAPPAAAEQVAEGEVLTPPKPPVETVGGEEDEDEEEGTDEKQRRRFVAARHYKIQEVIKRRQIMLIQVVKEERGNKGAALTTYLSLAGRYCVLMPNSPRGGGVSRKITSAQDRRRLKAILADLELPKNMAVILRTAGAERNKAEVKRDYEYLQRTWNNIREVTMTSRAPALIHEEASLIKRAIRDIYSRDIEEVWVEGEEGYKVGKDFMKMLTPSHAKKVQRYKDDIIPLFHRYQVESQMEAINSPIVQLRSGGSIVFAQTEALVAIDVNSGRATKERHIEETAYKTNCEAADEIARQLRLRDLAGLVVIDFIDMEDNRNNHSVERRLKEALKVDRARIQVGRISHFGLLELSRQRLRPSLIEANFRVCAHCAGSGMVRSTESAAVYSLRMLEEEGVRQRSSEVTITTHPDVALYLLNYKREALASIETRYRMRIIVLGDATLVPPNIRLDRVKAIRQPGEEEIYIPRDLPRPEYNAADDVPEEDDVSDAEDSDSAEPRESRGDRPNRDRPHRDRPNRDRPNRDRPHRDRPHGDRPHGDRPQSDRGDVAEAGERPEREEGRDDIRDKNGVRKRRRRRRRGGEREPRTGEVSASGETAQTEGAPRPQWQAPNVAAEGSEQGQGQPQGEGQMRDGQPPREGGDAEVRRGRRRGRRGGRRRRRGGEPGSEFANAEGGAQGEGFAQDEGDANGPQESWSEDAPTAAAPVHTQESAQESAPRAMGEPAASDANGTGERQPRGFFRALKEGFSRRIAEPAETASEAPQVSAPVVSAPVVIAPVIAPVSVPVERVVSPPPAAVAPPPPAPTPVPTPAPPPAPVVVAEEAPSGPPRKGWWNEPKG